MAECLGVRLGHGAVDAKVNTNPYVFTIMPYYKVNGQFEVVGRYSYLDTDRRGVRISGVVLGSEDATRHPR